MALSMFYVETSVIIFMLRNATFSKHR